MENALQFGDENNGERVSSDKQQVKLNEPQVESTELAYVTAINKSENTFFAQLCKYSNRDLVHFNKAIHNYCTLTNGAQAKSLNPPTQVKGGDIFCTRFQADNSWYRVCVKCSHQTKRECDVYFIDYGNIETVGYEYLLAVDPSKLPAIERSPFGLHCTFNDSDKLDTETQTKLLDTILEEYIMMKTLKREDWHHWTVVLPKVAYNSAFWLNFESSRRPIEPEKDTVGDKPNPQ